MSFGDNLRAQADDTQEIEQRYMQACSEWAAKQLDKAKKDLGKAVQAGNFSTVRKGLRKIRTVGVARHIWMTSDLTYSWTR